MEARPFRLGSRSGATVDVSQRDVPVQSKFPTGYPGGAPTDDAMIWIQHDHIQVASPHEVATLWGSSQRGTSTW